MARRTRKGRTWVAQGWNWLPWYGKLGVTAAAGTGLFIVGRKQYKNWKTKQTLKKFQSSNMPVQIAITDASGHTGYIQSNVNLATQAATIYDAFFNNDPLGMTEDEQKAVDALLKVPPSYMTELEKIYMDLYKKNLREDFVKYVSDNSYYWNQVKERF